MTSHKYDPVFLNRLYDLGRRVAQRHGWDEDKLHTAGLIAVAKHTQPESRIRLKDDKDE